MLEHVNIVQFYEFFETEETIFIIMELVSGGELLDYITQKGFLTAKETTGYMCQILSAVEYMHENGIVHRDLYEKKKQEDERINRKLENFVLTFFLEN
jgi:serine/threonine protein kinase